MRKSIIALILVLVIALPLAAQLNISGGIYNLTSAANVANAYWNTATKRLDVTGTANAGAAEILRILNPQASGSAATRMVFAESTAYDDAASYITSTKGSGNSTTLCLQSHNTVSGQMNTASCTSTIGVWTAPLYGSTTNCSDSAGDAACAAAPAGSVVVDAADTATVVSTTAVTANSQIFVMVDVGLGTRLSVTCNTQAASVFNPRVTARTAAQDFTITVDAGPTTNPLCLSYFIVN